MTLRRESVYFRTAARATRGPLSRPLPFRLRREYSLKKVDHRRAAPVALIEAFTRISDLLHEEKGISGAQCRACSERSTRSMPLGNVKRVLLSGYRYHANAKI